MSGKDDFERDLRQTLDELGSESVPSRLLFRVRSFPTTEPQPARLQPIRRRLAPYAILAAAAVVAVAVFGGLLLPLMNGNGPIANGSRGTRSPVTGSSTPTSAPQTSAPQSNAPSGLPTGTPGPQQTPSWTIGAAVPGGFDALSVTFASPTEGWVLGTSPCGQGRCTLVVHTADAGRTWTIRGTPNVAAAWNAAGGAAAPVGTIRFADSLHGWMYGSQLWATSDGGTTWTETSVAGFSPGRIFALEVARGVVHAVGFGQAGFAVATSAVGSGTWQVSHVSLPFGAGPYPTAQLVLSGGDGWIVQVDRTVVNGARFGNGAWAAWQPPCANVAGPAYVAASSSQNVVAVCEVGQWSTPQGTHLFVSADRGTSFAQSGTALPVVSVTGVATPGPSTIVVAGSAANAQANGLVASFDAGKSWSTVPTISADTILDLGFTTATQGVAIAVKSDGSTQLVMTRDGGHTWGAIAFS